MAETSKIVDKRRKPFAMVDVEVLRDPQIPPQCKALYALLISYGPERIFPGHERLANEMGRSRKTVVEWMQELKKTGLITWRRTGRSNQYEILGPTEQRCNENVTSDVRPGSISCEPQGTSDVTETLHDPDPSIQIHSPRSIEINSPPQQNRETQEQRLARLRATHGSGPVEGLLLAAQRGAGDDTSFTVPERAGGRDAYRDGPLTQWCALVGRQRANLLPAEETAWANELRAIADLRGANAETLTWALRQWGRAIAAKALEPRSHVWIPGGIAWMSPTTDTLFAYRDDPLRGISSFLAPLLEWGMEHGLDDIDLERAPQQHDTAEREEPPERRQV